MIGQHRSTAELYLRGLIVLLKERALDARQQRLVATEKDAGFASGRLMAFHEVISVMQHQALAFQIDLDDLGLSDIEPERDLI